MLSVAFCLEDVVAIVRLVARNRVSRASLNGESIAGKSHMRFRIAPALALKFGVVLALCACT